MNKMQYWRKSFLVGLLVMFSVVAKGQQPTSATESGTVVSPSNQAGDNSQLLAGESRGTSEDRSAAQTMSPITSVKGYTPVKQTEADYFLPALNLDAVAESNEMAAPGQSRFRYSSMLLGGFQLNRRKKRSDFNLDYAGSLLYSKKQLQAVGNFRPAKYVSIQQLGLSETLISLRWKLLLDDDFLYMPGTPLAYSGLSAFGGVSGGMGGGIASGVTGINPSLIPSQSILTEYARRLSNAAVGEIEFDASQRSRITASAVYGILHFLDGSYVNPTYTSALVGYSYLLSPRSQIGVGYVHTLFNYGAGYQQNQTQRILFSFGHRITRSFSLTLKAGPSLVQLAQPLGGVTTKGFVNTDDSLRYNGESSSFEIGFRRQVTGGSGVLVGATTNEARFVIGRELPRRFHLTVSIDHTNNRSLRQVSPLQPHSTYVLWEGGIRFSHRLNKRWRIFLMLKSLYQDSNTPTCIGGTCGRITRMQVGSIGLSWLGRKRLL